jgi:CysZ protein
MCRRTISILTGQDSDASMKAFIAAQVRMIKVVFLCYAMEMGLGIALKIFFGIFGFLDFLQPVFLFLISLFFLGYTVMDNYFEQFALSVKEGMHFSKQFIGIALGVGLVIQVLFMVPVIGTILAPMLAAVTVSIALYELTDLHLPTPVPIIIEEDLV